MSLVIDVENCKGCGLCVVHCSKGVLKMTTDVTNDDGYYFPVIRNEDGCIGCGACCLVCPEGRIEIY